MQHKVYHSNIIKVADDVSSWTNSNNMQANLTKTKEFFVCF